MKHWPTGLKGPGILCTAAGAVIILLLLPFKLWLFLLGALLLVLGLRLWLG